MTSVLRGVLMQSVLIECSVQSDIPFTLTFRKDGEMLGHQNRYQYEGFMYCMQQFYKLSHTHTHNVIFGLMLLG